MDLNTTGHHSNLLSLPPELRHEILGYLIPTNAVIAFAPTSKRAKHRPMLLYSPEHSEFHPTESLEYDERSGGITNTGKLSGTGKYRGTGKYCGTLSAFARLLPVCKLLCADLEGMLYGQNTFRFTLGVAPTVHYNRWGCRLPRPIDRSRWTPSNSFSAAKLPASVVLRIQKCELRVRYPVDEKCEYELVQSWLRRLTEYFGASCGRERAGYGCLHIHGASALRRFRVVYDGWRYELKFSRSSSWETRWAFDPLQEENKKTERARMEKLCQEYQLCLEPLVALRGIADVEIEGFLEEQLREELRAVMMSERLEGGRTALKKLNYGSVKVRRKYPGNKRMSTRSVSSRKFWQPEFGWEFMEDRHLEKEGKASVNEGVT